MLKVSSNSSKNWISWDDEGTAKVCRRPFPVVASAFLVPSTIFGLCLTGAQRNGHTVTVTTHTGIPNFMIQININFLVVEIDNF